MFIFWYSHDTTYSELLPPLGVLTVSNLEAGLRLISVQSFTQIVHSIIVYYDQRFSYLQGLFKGTFIRNAFLYMLLFHFLNTKIFLSFEWRTIHTT